MGAEASACRWSGCCRRPTCACVQRCEAGLEQCCGGRRWRRSAQRTSWLPIVACGCVYTGADLVYALELWYRAEAEAGRGDSSGGRCCFVRGKRCTRSDDAIEEQRMEEVICGQVVPSSSHERGMMIERDSVRAESRLRMRRGSLMTMPWNDACLPTIRRLLTPSALTVASVGAAGCVRTKNRVSINNDGLSIVRHAANRARTSSSSEAGVEQSVECSDKLSEASHG